jgi:hypothetical protein|tara:strand:- start:794 stop:1657 length:864 start_codon:yes stop_codon:yes gene_type:complete
MIGNYSFVEYSYNPSQNSREEIQDRLRQLKFNVRTSNANGTVTMWVQGLCIILVRETDTVQGPGLTGLGLTTTENPDTINEWSDEDIAMDEELGMMVANDTCGTRIILVNFDYMDSEAKLNTFAVVQANNDDATLGLTNMSGVVYSSCTSRMMDFYQDAMGFKFARSSDTYNTLTSENNRFTMLVNKSNTGTAMPVLICETHDVWHTTSACAFAGIDLKKFDKPDDLNYGSMNHKIVGYNCIAVGSPESYSIENLVPEALPGMDLIFRMRKQYMSIKEDSLRKHYAE